MLELKIYTVKICSFTSLVRKKVFHMLARQKTREWRRSGQGWKDINFLGGSIFSQTWLSRVLLNQITNFTKSCFCLCYGDFTKRTEWISDDMEQSECQTFSSCSRWCTYACNLSKILSATDNPRKFKNFLKVVNLLWFLLLNNQNFPQRIYQ